MSWQTAPRTPPHLVHGHRSADAAPTDHDPPFAPPGRHLSGHQLREVRVVVQRIVLLWPDVHYVVPLLLQHLYDVEFQGEPGMVRAHGYSHLRPSPVRSTILYGHRRYAVYGEWRDRVNHRRAHRSPGDRITEAAVTIEEVRTCPLTRLDIFRTEEFAEGRSFGEVGPYRLIEGTAHFAVDPSNERNAAITDLELAH